MYSNNTPNSYRQIIRTIFAHEWPNVFALLYGVIDRTLRDVLSCLSVLFIIIETLVLLYKVVA